MGRDEKGGEREIETTEKVYVCQPAKTTHQHAIGFNILQQEESDGKQTYTAHTPKTHLQIFMGLSPDRGWRKHSSGNMTVLQKCLKTGIVKALVHTPLGGLWK